MPIYFLLNINILLKHIQIEKLFDSLMRDYLINSFLFWQVRGEDI